MTKIEIFYKESIFDELLIHVNYSIAEYTVFPDRVVVECKLDFGIHQLTVQLAQGQRLNISDVRVNGASLRMMIYLSYIETSVGNKLQPATTLWENDQIWKLPFGNPVSFWQCLVYNKLSPGDFGTDLQERYHIYYPDSVDVDDKFPLIIQTFFKHNFDFACVKRNTPISQLPYYPIEIEMNHRLLNDAIAEIQLKHNWIVQNKHFVAQTVYNSAEFNQSPELDWIRLDLVLREKLVFARAEFPRLHDLIDSLGINDIKNIFMGILPAGGCIAPHKDRTEKVPMYDNDKHFHVYVPLLWSPGNLFKINGATILSDGKPYIINHMDYIHSLVNDSKQDRIILAIRAGVDANQHLI